MSTPSMVLNDPDAFMEGLAKYLADASDGEAGVDRIRVEGASLTLDYIETLNTPATETPVGMYSDKFYEYVALFF